MQCSIEDLRLSYENLSSLIHHRLELTYRDESDESADLREMDLETDRRTILRPSGLLFLHHRYRHPPPPQSL